MVAENRGRQGNWGELYHCLQSVPLGNISKSSFGQSRISLWFRIKQSGAFSFLFLCNNWGKREAEKDKICWQRGLCWHFPLNSSRAACFLLLCRPKLTTVHYPFLRFFLSFFLSFFLPYSLSPSLSFSFLSFLLFPFFLTLFHFYIILLIYTITFVEAPDWNKNK